MKGNRPQMSGKNTSLLGIVGRIRSNIAWSSIHIWSSECSLWWQRFWWINDSPVLWFPGNNVQIKKKVQCPILLPKLHDGERQCAACTYTKRNGNDKPAPAKISKPVATKALRALDMSSPYNCTNKGEKYIRLETTTKISICSQDSRKQWKLDNWKVNTILCLTRFCNYITVN